MILYSMYTTIFIGTIQNLKKNSRFSVFVFPVPGPETLNKPFTQPSSGYYICISCTQLV